MNRSKLHLLRNMATAALLCAGLASCSQDDLPGQNDPLPEGQYPITFTAVQSKATPEGAVQTRVSDNGNVSSWTAGDRIKVTVDGNGYTTPQEVTCTLDEYGKVTDYSRQLYWQTADATAQFTGVYPEQTENISLNQQHNALAYVMRATATGSYNTPAKLTFTHRLAKLCVTLKDESGQTLTGSNYKLSVLNYASCDNTSTGAQGKGNLMFIPMRYNAKSQCYEANIVPGTFNAGTVFYRIQKIESGKVTKEATAKLTTASTFNAGYVYSATVTAKTSDKWTSVITDRKELGNLSIENDIIVDLGQMFSENDPAKIKVTSGKAVTVTIRNTNIGYMTWIDEKRWPSGPIMSIGANATVTLKVEGKNSFGIKDGSGIEMQNGSSLTIIGDGRENSSLTILTKRPTSDQSAYTCIGSAYNREGTLELNGITIKDVKLDLTQGGNYGSFLSSPAIGLTYTREGNTTQSCKSIKIENSEVKITNNGDGACIGTPGLNSNLTRSNVGYKIGEIIIANSTIDATSHGYGACIGFGVKSDDYIIGTIGKISISTTNLKFKKSKTDSGAFCVGRGQMNTQVNPPTITNDIVVDGESCGKEGYNP